MRCVPLMSDMSVPDTTRTMSALTIALIEEYCKPGLVSKTT